ncbi:MAG: general secretion pathway protein GspB [Woeseiaceae bacterium]|nr:general secretion pathway protein GspB [Woeseiaceae bacterium]
MPDGIRKLLLALLLLTAATATGAQETLRDPTRPYNARPVAIASGGGGGGSAVSTYSVTAIFTSDSRRVAVVNGQRVVEGDTVDGATVIEILANSLSLDVHGKVVKRRVLPTGLRK